MKRKESTCFNINPHAIHHYQRKGKTKHKRETQWEDVQLINEGVVLNPLKPVNRVWQQNLFPRFRFIFSSPTRVLDCGEWRDLMYHLFQSQVRREIGVSRGSRVCGVRYIGLVVGHAQWWVVNTTTAMFSSWVISYKVIMNNMVRKCSLPTFDINYRIKILLELPLKQGQFQTGSFSQLWNLWKCEWYSGYQTCIRFAF